MEIGNLKGTEFLHEGKELKVTDVKMEGTTIILTTECIGGDTGVKKKYVLSDASIEKMKGVHPKLIELMKKAIGDSPYDFKVVQGLRTAEYQNSLYQQGRTKPGKIVTKLDGYNRKSNHQAKSDGYGHAVDIAVCGHYDQNGNYVKYTTDTEMFDNKKLVEISKHVKAVAKKMGVEIVWGGDWKTLYDTPHYELV
jgi:putative secretion activating protein|nr:MAG TPA: L alanyl D glutamate peptidase endolysin [Caudoviricetes sp.]